MEVKRVMPDEADRLMRDGYTYVDVRSESEWQSGHPPGSLNVPVAFLVPGQGFAPNPDFVGVCERNFAKDAKLLVGCKTGGRSYRAAEMLQAAGFTDVRDVRGGMMGEMGPTGQMTVPGWAARGLTVTRECPPEQSYPALAKG